MCNPAEATMLASAEGQQRAAAAIVATICEHFGVTPIPVPTPGSVPECQFPKAREFVMTNGISDGQRPKDQVTREELWEMLRRCNDHPLDNKG